MGRASIEEPAGSPRALLLIDSTQLLNFVVGQVSICLCQFDKFRLVIGVWLGNFESTDAIDWIRFNFGNTVNRFESASDRGGATRSDHVGDVQRHHHRLGIVACYNRFSSSRFRRRHIDVVRLLTADPGGPDADGHNQVKNILQIHFRSPVFDRAHQQRRT